ncbi:hypothetical protein FRC12_014902 [Ceratobasidium sp. 428]|nr:hypothetical protein FRC12_014902 [Ceratobasidium sp. 428]
MDDLLQYPGVLDLKLQNSKRCVNKLPHELLLRIFRAGGEMQRRRGAREPCRGLQDLATQVCTQWRDVAINSPVLWTYIYISRPPPHHSAALYLDRCGPTNLLDLDLEIMNDFFHEDIQSDNRARMSETKKIIAFLVQHGAGTRRWKSLKISSEVLPVLLEMLKYVHPRLNPTLQYLSIEWSLGTDIATAMESEIGVFTFLSVFDRVYPHTNEPFPRLRHVDMITVPSALTFRRPLPMLVDLTHLGLHPAFKLCSHSQLYDLLSDNPRLESLDIAGGILDENVEPNDLQIVLPSLRSLSVALGACPAWTLGVIMMIDGPAIERLKLSLYGYRTSQMIQVIEQIVSHITSKYHTNTQPVATHEQTASRQQIYPALRLLDISGLCPANDQTKSFGELFLALPGITLLVARASIVAILGDQRRLLPHLEHVRLVGEAPKELCRVLYSRAKAGHPVKVLEVYELFLDSIQVTLPESLALVTIPAHYNYDDQEINEDDFDEHFDPDHDDFDEHADSEGSWSADDDTAASVLHEFVESDEDHEGSLGDNGFGYGDGADDY